MRFIRSILLRMSDHWALCAKGRFVFLFSVMLFVAVPDASWARLGVDYQMQLGNPTIATVDTNNHTHYLIQRSQYAMDYNDTTHQANWVSWSYTSTDTGSTARQDSYRADTNLPTGFTRIGSATFGTGYDRGHMCPSADRTTSVADNDATFFMSNMIPQASKNNQGLWATFEGYCRGLASGGSEVLITCGPGDFGATSISNGMKLPGSVWKVIVVAPSGTALASSKVTSACRVIAIHTPNTASVSSNWTDYITTVEEIEATTGYTFFSSLPTSVARYLRKVKDTGSGPNTPTVISSISPISGTAGTTVTLSGYNFGTSPVVKFNGVTATASVQNGGTQITAAVPASATTGTISVASTSNGTDTSAEIFTVSTSPFESWSVGYKLSGANALASADPDGDSLNNAGEFAFGTSPVDASSRAVTQSSVTGGIKIIYLQRSGVTYTVKSATDLAAGFTGTVTPSKTSPQPTVPSGYEQYEATLTNGKKGFLKVEAVVP